MMDGSFPLCKDAENNKRVDQRLPMNPTTYQIHLLSCLFFTQSLNIIMIHLLVTGGSGYM